MESNTPKTPFRSRLPLLGAFSKPPVDCQEQKSPTKMAGLISLQLKYFTPRSISQGREPMKAFLRICPPQNKISYIQVLDEKEVLMKPPPDSNAYKTRNTAPERYTFTKVFPGAVSQQEFFENTTLSSVQDVFRGVNGLIFAYGTTNSGKTFSVRGTQTNPGILPRTLNTIFKSIEGRQLTTKLRPCHGNGIERYLEEEPFPFEVTCVGTDSPNPCIIEIDTNHNYGIWISYHEVYNEKIYDLLGQAYLNEQRKPLSLKTDSSNSSKYVNGRNVRIRTLEEAYAILREGDKNRIVFPTLANHESSRGHGVFTIKILRLVQNDDGIANENPAFATVSQLSIVDLAGSERHRNTKSTGQRLKEANNINKSLMVLGQCLQTLRANQLMPGKRTKIIPFRHSKLTEIFKSSFTGDGQIVMIVNINPFDTGFDENNHVMRFSSITKDVKTFKRTNAYVEYVDCEQSIETHEPLFCAPLARISSDSDESGSGGKDNYFDESFEDEDTDDPFVNQLISKITEINEKWAEAEARRAEAEARCAELETVIREEVANEFSQKFKQSEQAYMDMLLKEHNINEEKMERKLELLSKDMDMPLKLENSGMRIQELEQENYRLVGELSQVQALLDKERMAKEVFQNKVTALVLRNDVWLTDEFAEKEMFENDYIRFEDVEVGLEEGETEDVSESLHDSFNCNLISPLKSPKKAIANSPLPILSKVRGKLYDSPAHSFSPKAVTGPEGKVVVLRRHLHSVVAAEKVNFVELNAVMSEIERMTITDLDIIKMSKMWKQMRQISVREFEHDPYNTRCRAKRLLKRWAALQEKTLSEPSMELSRNLSLIVRRSSSVECTALNVKDENTDPNASIETPKVAEDIEVQEKKKKRKLRAKKGLFEKDIDEKANEILSPGSKNAVKRTR